MNSALLTADPQNPLDDNNDTKYEKLKWMPIEAADIAMASSYIAFGLFALLIVSDLVVILLGGKFFFLRLLFDSSFAVWGLLLKRLEMKYKNKTN